MEAIQAIWYMCIVIVFVMWVPIGFQEASIKGRFCRFCGQKVETKRYKNRILDWVLGIKQLCPDPDCVSHTKKPLRFVFLDAVLIVGAIWLMFYTLLFRRALIEEAISTEVIDGLGFVLFFIVIAILLYETKHYRGWVKTLEVS